MRKYIIFVLVLCVGFLYGATTITSDRTKAQSSYDIIIDSTLAADSNTLHTMPIEGSLQWIGLIGTGTDSDGLVVNLVDEDGFKFYTNASMDANDIHAIKITDVDGNAYAGADVSSRFTLTWSDNDYTTVRFKVHVSASN